MANELKKAPVLSDLLKSELSDYKGREEALFTSADALRVGTVLMGGPAAAEPWDLSDVEDIYGILVADVPAGSTAYRAAVLFAGPATIDPTALVWETGATGGNIEDGLERLKKDRFVFTRQPATTALYPDQINRVPD